MRILAIDPGTFESAFVLYDSTKHTILDFDKISNDALLGELESFSASADVCVIEMIKSYGMAVGDSVFETCVWIGRFMERWPSCPKVQRLSRKTVASELCGKAAANDANIRAEVLNRFGGSRGKACGTKTAPGPLYGVKLDIFSALAVALVYAEQVERTLDYLS